MNSSQQKPSFFNQPLTHQLNSINRMKSDIAMVGARYEKLAKLEKNPYEVRKQLQDKRSAFLSNLVDKL
jgi:hypothetical protein